MKTVLSSFGWLLLLLPFISLAGTKTILRANYAVNEERQVANFSGVSSSGSFDVYIKMGSTEDLRIEGDEEQIKRVETKIENGILKIRHLRSTGSWNWGMGQKIKIYITAKKLNHLSVSGSGDMEVSGPIKSENLNTRVSGSGSVRMDVQCSRLTATVSGSGDITARGTATAAIISVSGSGEFEGKGLKTGKTDVKVSGSGDVSIYAEQNLNANVSGSGNIVYSGNAQVNQSKTGSGRISKR